MIGLWAIYRNPRNVVDHEFVDPRGPEDAEYPDELDCDYDH